MANVLRNLVWITVGLVFTCALAPAPLKAQAASAKLGSAPPFLGGVYAVLLGMASHAGVIFAGHVVALDRSDAAGFVDIHFRIDEPIRGCPRTGVYVLREWAGRWVGHPDRYRVGQHWLMLLTTRGPSGMSAPVFGGDGAVPILASASQPILGSNGVPPDDAGVAPESTVDLRLLQARVVRTTSAFVVESPLDSTRGVARPIAPLRTPGDKSVKPLFDVLALLRASSGGALAAR